MDALWVADTRSHRGGMRVKHSCKTENETHRGTDRHTDTLASGPTAQTQRNRGTVWAALVACLSSEDWSETVECSTGAARWGWGGGWPFRSARGRRPGARELPDASRERLRRF